VKPCPGGIVAGRGGRAVHKSFEVSWIWSMSDRSAAGKKQKSNKPLEKLALTG